jgi:hypothetical protein
MTNLRTKRKAAANKAFAIAGVQCFVDSLVVNYSFVLRMKFSAKTPRHRKPPKRQVVKKLKNFKILVQKPSLRLA